MSPTVTTDDYARLHYAFHEDTDLERIADQLDDEHGMGSLVFLYWPRMIAKAKQAKSFGWFSATPRALAASVRDRLDSGGSWAARARMWELLAASDIIRVRQAVVENPSDRIDVLLVEWEKWQSWSPRERTFLSRERGRVEAGEAPHWTVRHLDEFAFAPVTTREEIVTARYTETETRDAVTENRYTVTETRDGVTTLDETRQDETKVGARDRADLPTSVLQTIQLVREIPGHSPRQLESNVRKLLLQFPSLTDAQVCEAITAFEANVEEGKTLRSQQAWMKMRNCFVVAARRAGEQDAASKPRPRRLLADVLAADEASWGVTPA
jgi:hypothetical protein